MSRPTDTRKCAHVPLVQVVRGGTVEKEYHGSVVVLAPDGAVEFQAGDIEAEFHPHSALGPLQAVAMLRAGLWLDGELLALGASGHSGEKHHVAGVRRILHTAGLDDRDLRNTPALPFDPMLRDGWVSRGRGPSRITQTCSGQHAAMLLTAHLEGWPTTNYLDRGHPLQEQIADTVRELTGRTAAGKAVGWCGAPVFAASLVDLATAYSRIAVTDAGSESERVVAALRAFPNMRGPMGRGVFRLTRTVPGLLAGDSLDGVVFAALPDGRAAGVRIVDAAERAARVTPPVVAAALAACGVASRSFDRSAGRVVGGGTSPVPSIRVAGELARRAAPILVP